MWDQYNYLIFILITFKVNFVNTGVYCHSLGFQIIGNCLAK